jgi:hypothetical protein
VIDTRQPTSHDYGSRHAAREACPLPVVGKAVLVGVGLVAIMTLFIVAYSGAFSDPQPHHIPVAVEVPRVVAHIAERSVRGGLIIRSAQLL